MLDCEVLSVVPMDGKKLLLRFATGEKKVFDRRPLLRHKINAPLENEAFFRTARVEAGTVVWSDKIDIDPEYLYEASVKNEKPSF